MVSWSLSVHSLLHNMEIGLYAHPHAGADSFRGAVTILVPPDWCQIPSGPKGSRADWIGKSHGFDRAWIYLRNGVTVTTGIKRSVPTPRNAPPSTLCAQLERRVRTCPWCSNAFTPSRPSIADPRQGPFTYVEKRGFAISEPKDQNCDSLIF